MSELRVAVEPFTSDRYGVAMHGRAPEVWTVPGPRSSPPAASTWIDVILTRHDVVQPDLVVVTDSGQISGRGIEGAPGFPPAVPGRRGTLDTPRRSHDNRVPPGRGTSRWPEHARQGEWP